jgi:hypothetical protein
MKAEVTNGDSTRAGYLEKLPLLKEEFLKLNE